MEDQQDMNNDMNNYMNDMGMGGNDMMDIMAQTHQQIQNNPSNDSEEPANGNRPSLIAQTTTQMHRKENTLTGTPLNYKSPLVTPAEVTINLAPAQTYADVTINLGAAAKEVKAQSIEPYMDDDLDDFDAKDDLTKDQQQQDGNINLARHIDQELDRVATDVMNVDELEQQYRMTKDPDNPNNIFVLKFGKDEEQHWRLPWNPTTNLLCHMEPNKLLIEQSKYNAMYIKCSITPAEYKRQATQRKKTAMLAAKEKNKKYKVNVNVGTPIPEEKASKPTKPQTAKFSQDLSNNKGVASLAAPTANNNLLGAPAMDDKPKARGTFMMNSMLIHSEQTVASAAPTEQDKVMQMQDISTSTTNLVAANNGSLTVSPLTAQIRPELIMHSKPANINDNVNNNNANTDANKDNKKPKHQRRVSLGSVGDEEEWNNHDEDDYSDSDIESEEENEYDDDDYDGNENGMNNNNNNNNNNDKLKKRISSKLNNIQLSVSIEQSLDSNVQRLDSKNRFRDINEYAINNNENTGDFGRSEYEEQKQKQLLNTEQPSKGNLRVGIQSHIGRASTADISEWSPPKMSLQQWNAVDVWQGILYLGDEWDALNYLEIMDNKIEYFINCASGYCAFEYEKKLKYFWLENWRRKREKEREKQKYKNSIEREKRRKQRLKKFQRANPEWKPKNRKLLLQNAFSTMSNQQKMNADEYNKLDEIVQFAMKMQPNDSPIPTVVNDGKMVYPNESVKKIRYKIGNNTATDVKQEFEYFCENREEYKIISDLHNEILYLEVDDSDHSSMYDSCMSSDEYLYDSDEFDEYLTMSDEEIINKLCPFKFLNIYAHNWEGYRLLDLHMNDIWNFIEQCRMQNMNLKTEWKYRQENMDDSIAVMNEKSVTLSDKPPKVSCLIFCTKNNIAMDRLNAEISSNGMNGMNGMDLISIGNSICSITDTYRTQQLSIEDNIWNQQIETYQLYLDKINDMQQKNEKKVNHNKIKHQIVSTIRNKNSKIFEARRYAYKYWNLPDAEFWNDFHSLKTRDEPLNRLFGSSHDRSAALVLGFMVHSGIRLKQALKALLQIKPNILRNQSFLRQLIQLDWMKHCFAKPGMREQVPFRDEYNCYELDTYLMKKQHYNLK